MGRSRVPEPLTAADMARIYGSNDQGRGYVPLEDRLERTRPRRANALCEGSAGARLLALVNVIPGFWSLWDREVPETAREGLEAVNCPCGARSVLEEGLTWCAGECGRAFLRVRDRVYAHRFPLPMDSAERAA